VRAATIYDVARRAGVSHQTVTRYLQGYPGIRPETRDRVRQALADLDYRPNSAARLLRSRRTNRIGVLVDRIDERGPARILAGVSELARTRGYVLDVVIADSADPASVAESLAVLVEHQVAGIIATAQTEVVRAELRQQATARVMVSPGASDGSQTVNELAGQLAADHLIDLGHHRLGYLAGPPLWLAAADRTRGFVRRVEERDADLAWIRHGDWSAESGFDSWRSLNPEERRVTAVAAGNDSMAIGALSAAVQSGLSVPEDLGFIGTDDLPEARYLVPSLSTVAMDFEAEGRQLLKQLLATLDGTAGACAAVTPPRVVARQSTRRLVPPPG
jgi:DNA-binding LacI/PurR family transcriptional regulator